MNQLGSRGPCRKANEDSDARLAFPQWHGGRRCEQFVLRKEGYPSYDRSFWTERQHHTGLASDTSVPQCDPPAMPQDILRAMLSPNPDCTISIIAATPFRARSFVGPRTLKVAAVAAGVAPDAAREPAQPVHSGADRARGGVPRHRRRRRNRHRHRHSGGEHGDALRVGVPLDASGPALRTMVRTTATVLRQVSRACPHGVVGLDPEQREVPLDELVPGDLVHLSAGDMIPAG